MVLRLAIGPLKSLAIVVALPLGIGLAVQVAVFALSDRDVGGAFGSGLARARIVAGIFGLVITIVIILRRIADVED
ncbi:hypothetical protein SAMN05216337_105044 [Bradyrhizobium brasilense]|uniref:Uncharacterized protein n=1 Tax=Bradyrhizobium brasilense TaxID=1419277 RepID=A0A1G7JY87_9BRAD|nr:hypothetical protein [Bradyrhizobium brasilense]SDF29529.1 hypothetical protein SAMN05216337_105044 [Bradyrhizobium brasilense]